MVSIIEPDTSIVYIFSAKPPGGILLVTSRNGNLMKFLSSDQHNEMGYCFKCSLVQVGRTAPQDVLIPRGPWSCRLGKHQPASSTGLPNAMATALERIKRYQDSLEVEAFFCNLRSIVSRCQSEFVSCLVINDLVRRILVRVGCMVLSFSPSVAVKKWVWHADLKLAWQDKRDLFKLRLALEQECSLATRCFQLAEPEQFLWRSSQSVWWLVCILGLILSHYPQSKAQSVIRIGSATRTLKHW